MSDFDYIYIVASSAGGFNVKGVDKFPETSVLAGQPRKTFLAYFHTLEEAQAEYPEADLSHPIFEPRNYYGHLPGEVDL